VADEPVTARRPNRVLSLVLLVVATLGTAAFLIVSFIEFFEAQRGPAMKHFSYGVLWFLFFSWAARVAMRPFPAPQ
jgi:hypothetical protein